MSIQGEITRLSTNVSDALDAIEAKGVTVPSGSNSDDLADLIALIPSGGGSAVTVTESPDIGGGVVKEITAVDISADTVDAEHLLSGYTAHDRNGTAITGTYIGGPSKFTARITATGNANNYVTYNSTNYYTAANTFVFEAGTTLTVKGANRTDVTVNVDGQQAAYSSSGSLTWSYTLPSHNIDISITVATLTTTFSISENASTSISITSNGTHAVAGFETANVNVSAPAPNLQSKSVTYTPSSSSQTDTVTADAGYDGLQSVSVTVNAATGGIGTLLGTLAVGSISTSSTSATDTGKSITVKGVYAYDLLICECSVDTKTNNRHAATTRLLWLTAGTDIGTKNGSAFATATWNVKLSSTGVATSRSNTTPYGIYANGCTVSAGNTGDNGQAVITIYQRYNSTQTGTINGTYTMRVYGVKTYDLIGG